MSSKPLDEVSYGLIASLLTTRLVMKLLACNCLVGDGIWASVRVGDC